ncbi:MULTISPECIES: FAD-dependent oxidoreductase [unclassified Nocardioides]|uniref:FAD-dependent oxidoreductase n=1 Tax=unclassified Nocardioides TaxID=2615069 RepID=UPI0009E92439|nr:MULTISPECIES: FAD-dependent oxidoreductase [unclassified Nocardioides]
MRVTVLGAGVIGLTVADELIRRGHTVAVVDPHPARGASYAAAGMLSPAAEVWHGEEEILRLGTASLALWPALADRLGVELRTAPTLLVGYDAGDLQQVERQAALVGGLGGRATLLDRAAVRACEPVLARVAGAASLEGEMSVDPRAVCAALLARIPVVSGDPGGADVTVVATGACLPEPWAGLVRGVRGEILRVRSDDPPTHTVRGWVGGEPIYLVPRGNGEVVVGATAEEHQAPPVVTAGGVHRLLTAGRTLWPGLDRAELVESTARDRPATADGRPLIGPSGADGVVLAAGHHRHGVLLAPLTARLVADLLDGAAVDPSVDPRRLITAGKERHVDHAQR